MLKLSIITPSFNQGRFLETALESVASQGYPNLQHIVIDGGSTDGTLLLLQKWADRVQWISEPDRGQAEALNKGFSRAEGDVLAWLNADDFYLPGALGKVAEVFETHPEIQWLYGDVQFVDEEGRFLFIDRPGPFNFRKLLYLGVSYIPQPGVFFRRTLLEAVGPLDVHLYHSMDYDLWLRFGQKTPAYYLPQTLSAFRVHSHSKTQRAVWCQIRESRQVRSRYLRKASRLLLLAYDLRLGVGLFLRVAKRRLVRVGG